MPGCSKSILIPAFNIQKNLNEKNKIIEFTPDKSGTFNIMCSMNMYRGTFIVLENDGTKSNYFETPSATGGSCSMGGCGCGGMK
ncbi:cupredoxin domain-containing protein [Candidatus Pacearchaeota archaeon]|nr:cupredoxin domain-containing protein [Candidatus Pacearchaeota archaeon]